jgi:hypothetical protein
MNQVVKKLILSIWIGITISIDLFLSKIAFWIVRFTLALNEGGPFRKDTPYAMPVYEVILHQVIVSIVTLSIGIICAGIGWKISARILLLFRFYRPDRSRFDRLNLQLLQFGIIAIGVGITIGNIDIIYDQIQGRARFDRVLNLSNS